MNVYRIRTACVKNDRFAAIIIQRSLLLLTTVILTLVGMGAHAEPQQLTDANVPFFYEARAAIPTPEHKLAAIVSADYKQARDEFTRHDLLEQIRPVLAERKAEALATQEVMLKVGGRLGDYDFASRSFPTGFGDGSFIPFKNSYAVTFENGESLSSIPVDVEHARGLSGALRSGRRIVTTIFGEITGSEEKRLRYNANKTIQVRVTRISVALKSGTLVGEKPI